jgi:hypothetical protein
MIEIRGDDFPRRQKLSTQELREKLPDLYIGEKDGLVAKALVKFFTPSGNWSWYANGHRISLGHNSQRRPPQVHSKRKGDSNLY